VTYNGFHHIIEMKMVHTYQTPESVRQTGLNQVRRYRDKFPPGTPAYLVIFDRRPETKQKPWEERITWNHEDDITILGC